VTLRGAPVDSLLVNIGGVISYVGSEATVTNTSGRTAEVVLRTNDNNPGNGFGSFTGLLDGPAWRRIGHANGVSSMTSTADRLFALTNDGGVWSRPRSQVEVNWTLLERRADFVAIEAVNEQLYAATTGDRLLTRPVTGGSWLDIGHANRVTALAGHGELLYATTSDGKLWKRDRVPHEVNWTVMATGIDPVRELTTTSSGSIYALGRDQRLRAMGPFGTQFTDFGPVPQVVALARGLEGQLFAATVDGHLLHGRS